MGGVLTKTKVVYYLKLLLVWFLHVIHWFVRFEIFMNYDFGFIGTSFVKRGGGQFSKQSNFESFVSFSNSWNFRQTSLVIGSLIGWTSRGLENCKNWSFRDLGPSQSFSFSPHQCVALTERKQCVYLYWC